MRRSSHVSASWPQSNSHEPTALTNCLPASVLYVVARTVDTVVFAINIVVIDATDPELVESSPQLMIDRARSK